MNVGLQLRWLSSAELEDMMLSLVFLEGPVCGLCGKVSVSTCRVRGPVFGAVSVAAACCPTLSRSSPVNRA